MAIAFGLASAFICFAIVCFFPVIFSYAVSLEEISSYEYTTLVRISKEHPSIRDEVQYHLKRKGKINKGTYSKIIKHQSSIENIKIIQEIKKL